MLTGFHAVLRWNKDPTDLLIEALPCRIFLLLPRYRQCSFSYLYHYIIVICFPKIILWYALICLSLLDKALLFLVDIIDFYYRFSIFVAFI